MNRNIRKGRVMPVTLNKAGNNIKYTHHPILPGLLYYNNL